MKIRLYISQKISGQDLQLDKEQAHYLKNVLRKKSGDEVFVFNKNDGEFLGEILSMEKNSATIAIEKQTQKFIQKDINLTVAFSIIKPARISTLIEKCTEIGVDNFQPIITDRTDIAKLNVLKFQKTAVESSEQCGRLDIPEIKDTLKLNQFLNTIKDFDLVLIADERIPKETVSTDFNAKNICVVIGPEGGFTDKEFQMFKTSGVKSISLGKNILRAETAAIVASSKILI